MSTQGTPSIPGFDRPVGELTYEQARDELVAVVQRLEAGGESLEASLALWERGEALAARCHEWLEGARRRLDAARAATANGATPGTGPAGGAADSTGEGVGPGDEGDDR